MMAGAWIAGQQTSRIGLGCGRLVGGAGYKESAAIVEEALALGIRHFDVAPSYGLGLAEDVLGRTLAGMKDVTIVTKVGIGRPKGGALRAIARGLVRPALLGSPKLRARLGAKIGAPSRGLFASEEVKKSVSESLRRLQRSSVTGVLLHEVSAGELTAEVRAALADMLASGTARGVGSGTSNDLEALTPFGSISQYRWNAALFARTTIADQTHIMHGVLRRYAPAAARVSQLAAEMKSFGIDWRDPNAWPGVLLTLALASNSRAIVLISSNSVAQLRSATQAIRWDIVQDTRLESQQFRGFVHGALCKQADGNAPARISGDKTK